MISNNEITEYSKSTSELIRGTATRGLVVSTEDPLYSGRVKVYIPTIHGGLSDLTENENTSTTNRVANVLATLSPSAIEALPWASVIGYGWGPTGDPVNGTSNNVYTGSMMVPAYGTEVIVIFEQDDPNFPIILGSVFHHLEALSLIPTYTSVIAPGISAFDSTGDVSTTDYQNAISKVAVIKSDSGSSLCISDIDNRGHMALSKTIPYYPSDLLPVEKYEQYRVVYPAFPTTASAALEVSKCSSATDTSIVPDQRQSSALPKASTKRYPVTISPVLTEDGKFKLVTGEGSSAVTNLGIKINNPGQEISVVLPITATIYGVNSEQTEIYFKGDDNSVHVLSNLKLVDINIVKQLQANTFPKLEGGKAIGTLAEQSYLYWEVMDGGEVVTSLESLLTIRQLHIFGGASLFEYTDPQTHETLPITKTYPAQSTQDPAAWLTDSASLYLEAGQLDEFAATAIFNNRTYARQFGLYCSTDSGAESLYLKHPSGSYMGFDIDGNIILYSVGDIVVRSNRSVYIDTLGAFLVNCMAFLGRATALWKTMSTAYSTKRLSAEKIEKDWPPIMKRLVDSRTKDMKDAMTHSASLANYCVSKGTAVNLGTAYSNGGFFTSPAKASANFSLTTYDSLIKKYHKLYFTDDKTLPAAIKTAITPLLLKCQMLKESNGNPNAISPVGACGLFQIMNGAAQDIKGPGAIARNYMNPPEVNIDIGIQYMKRISKQIYNSCSGAAITSDDLAKETLLAYNHGIGNVTRYIKTAKLRHLTPNYLQIEQLLLDSRISAASKKEASEYAPTIYSFLSKTII